MDLLGEAENATQQISDVYWSGVGIAVFSGIRVMLGMYHLFPYKNKLIRYMGSEFSSNLQFFVLVK